MYGSIDKNVVTRSPQKPHLVFPLRAVVHYSLIQSSQQLYRTVNNENRLYITIYNLCSWAQSQGKTTREAGKHPTLENIAISILGRGGFALQKHCGGTDVCCINKYSDIGKGLVPILIFYPPPLGSWFSIHWRAICFTSCLFPSSCLLRQRDYSIWCKLLWVRVRPYALICHRK